MTVLRRAHTPVFLALGATVCAYGLFSNLELLKRFARTMSKRKDAEGAGSDAAETAQG